MPADLSAQQHREARIRELEARLERRSGIGVKAPVSLLALLCALALLGKARPDLRYYFSSRTPLTLGAEGDYRVEAFLPHRYAQVHGIPTTRGVYSQEGGQTYVTVGLRDSALLVRRRALEGETWQPGALPPQPNQTPFSVRGRLVPRADAQKYEQAFVQLAGSGQVRPGPQGDLWLLMEGERPGADWRALLMGTGLALFAVMNGWFLFRELKFRWGQLRRKRRLSEAEPSA